MKNSIKTRIIVYLVLFNVVIFSIFFWNNLVSQKALISEVENQYASEIENTVNTCLSTAMREAELLADILITYPGVKDAFVEQDREKLANLTQPIFQDWKKSHDVAQMQFINPNITSFYRVHKPQEYGDDLSYRMALSQAIKNQEKVIAVEEGVAGYGIRTIIPVFDGNNFVGVYEIGMSLEEKAGAGLSSLEYGNFYIMSFADEPQLLWGANDPLINITPADKEKLSEGEEFYRSTKSGDYILALTPIKDVENNVVAYIQAEIPRDHFIKLESQAKTRSLAIALIALLVLSGATYLILLQALRHLKPLQGIMQDVSEGDLTKIVEFISTDEIGKLASDFSILVQKVKQVFFSLFSSTSQLNANAQLMHNVSESSIKKLFASVEELNRVGDWLRQAGENLREADVGVEEIAKASQMVAEQAHNLQEIYVVLAGTARDSRKDISEVDRVVDGLKLKGQSTVEKVRELDAISKDIGQITNTIMAVSEQTNLLALNAAIESARAGEQGRGFAVVAEEIRKLAEETAQYTKQISVLINNVQNNISNFVEEVESMEIAIAEGSRTTSLVVGNLDNMVNQIVNIEGVVLEITSAMEEQSASSEEISAVVNNVSSATVDLIDNLDRQIVSFNQQEKIFKDLAQVIDDTSSISDDLRGLVAQYKLPDEIILNQVKSDHREFVKEYEYIVRNDLNIDPATITDHLHCRLGRWLQGVEDRDVLDVFAKVAEDPHKKVHLFAREAVELNNAGNKELALEKVNLMQEASKHIIEAIDIVINNLKK